MSASSAAQSAQPRASEASRINDRYRVERVLGQGGMGEVLAVLEPATGKRYALKRLLPGAKPRIAALLSREFHTLASLKHPHIVRAFDYGTCDGVPYYTMELLLGSDVESLAPLPWTDVVRILRDVASALSLLHARHLVHRDVGARNVWRTPEGVVKLIDFGTMTSFGASSHLAGTPPYVAPEALRTHLLDQRTDLYSLGALGYFLLTGRHAYPARSLAELEQHWAQGIRPASTRVSELGRGDLPPLPDALDQLIEALMAAAPEARPSSATEVLDRLNEVLPGEGGHTTVAFEAVLASHAFVGRTSERAQLRALIQGALSGTGASAALLGPRGIGRSRLLAEVAVDARLLGANVIAVAGDGERGTLTVAARATLKLLETLPSIARACAIPYASVLGHLSEELRSVLGVEREALEHFPELLGEARLRLQTALQAFWLEVSTQKPLVLLLDDLQGMDEASIALFTTLARDAGRRKLVIAAAVQSEHDAVVPACAQPFVARSLVVPLLALTPDDCREMLRSLFGDAEHLARTAGHLADRAEGNPGQLMELCEYLVHGEKIRCVDGVWVLPQEASELLAPTSLLQLEAARLGRLGEAARSLAEALCVLPAAIPLELCSPLSPLPPEGLFAALDELCAVGVLVQGEHGYAFRSESLRGVLVAALSPERAARFHAAAGEAILELESSKIVQRLGAGVHLLRGGSLRRGAEVVHRALVEAIEQMPEERAEIAQQVEQAYEHVSKLDLDDCERLSFLSLLSWSGYFVDRRFGFTYGDEAIACGERVCGMNLARRIAPWLGRRLGLYVALIVAGVRLRKAAKQSALVPDLKLAITLFMTAAGSLSGLYTLCMEREKVLASARAIEPLTALGPDHTASIVHRFAVSCAGSVSDRMGESGSRWQELIARLEDPRPITGLADHMRLYYQAACLYVWGNNEVWRDKSRTLELAERLERQPIHLYQISADQIRAVYYAQQGNMREAARHRERVEMRALQRGMTWQVEIWEPSSTVASAARQRDAMALKRASGQLSHLTSSDTASLRDYVDIAQACYLNLRGHYTEALVLLEALVQRRSPELVGYANLVGMLGRCYNALGRFAEAERVTSEAVARLRPADLEFPGLTLRVQIELALAHSGLGRHERAAAQLDALLAQHKPNAGPLTLGELHDARASVALRAQQEQVARHHVEAMERWYRSTDCPGLIEHCDRIARRWPKDSDKGAAADVLPSMSALATLSEQFHITLQQDSPNGVIVQLTRATMAGEGVLYFIDGEGRRRVVKSRAEELPSELSVWVEERMGAQLTFATETEDSEDELRDPNTLSIAGETWRLFLLVSEQGELGTLVGAVALRNPAIDLPLDVQQLLAQHLQAGRVGSLLSSQWA